MSHCCDSTLHNFLSDNLLQTVIHIFHGFFHRPKSVGIKDFLPLFDKKSKTRKPTSSPCRKLSI